MAYFGWVQAAVLYVYMISHDCQLGSDGRNSENIAVTGNKYCIFGWVQRPQKINCYMWKICRGEPRNLEKFVTENCGPY